MATITEDYVSFEIAKLLKEKGFNSEIDTYYSPEGEFEIWSPNERKSYLTNDGNETWWWKCIAPSQAMAMKWLREKFNIVISIIFISDQKREDRNSYSWIVYTADTFKWNTKEAEKSQVSYELACESAIKYCLEHLI